MVSQQIARVSYWNALKPKLIGQPCTSRETRYTVLQLPLLPFVLRTGKSVTAFVLGKFTVQREKSMTRHGKKVAGCIGQCGHTFLV